MPRCGLAPPSPECSASDTEVTGQLQPAGLPRLGSIRTTAMTDGCRPTAPSTRRATPIRSTGSSVTTTTGWNKIVAILPDLGKQRLAKSASDARCHSAFAATR